MKNANVMRGLAAAVLFASLAPIACGSDSSNKDGTSNPDKNTGDEDAGAPPPSIPAGSVGCGSKVCSVPDGDMGTACCMDPFAGTCGLQSALGGGCAKAPPAQPKDCPMLPSVGGFITLRSCCTTGGECGIDESMFQAGCVNYADAKAMAAMYTGGGGADAGPFAGMFNITLPAEQNCTPTPAM
jgi:hypothetical protein